MTLSITSKKLKELVATIRKTMNEFIPSVYEPVEVVAKDLDVSTLKKDTFGRFIIPLDKDTTVKATFFRGESESATSYDLQLCKSTRDVSFTEGVFAGQTIPKGQLRGFRLMVAK